jgi:hypothetical protein
MTVFAFFRFHHFFQERFLGMDVETFQKIILVLGAFWVVFFASAISFALYVAAKALNVI